MPDASLLQRSLGRGDSNESDVFVVGDTLDLVIHTWTTYKYQVQIELHLMYRYASMYFYVCIFYCMNKPGVGPETV